MLKLDVQSSTTVKHKKPFSKFTWLKEEDEHGLYAIQGSKPNQLTLSTGKVKKVEILKQLWSHLVNINYSLNGHHCAGVLDDGDVMIWHVSVKLPPLRISSPLSGGQLQSRRGVKIFVSNSSDTVLLVSMFNEFFLSKIENAQNYTWWKVAVGCFPTLSDADKSEAIVDAQFYRDQVNGDCLSCAVIYSPCATSDTIAIHYFTVQLLEDSSTGSFHVQHKILSYSSDALCGCSNGPRGRGALVMKHSPNGKLIALAVNYHKKSLSRVLFLSPQCNVMTAISPYGEKKDYGRAWWITDMAWTADGLLLVCIIKRGSLLVLPCMGRPLQLVTRGCSLDMGPLYLLPLHPRISYIPAAASSNRGNDTTDNEVSLSSERDSYKQKISVATHPSLPIILCSDGYLLTVMKLEETYCLTSLVIALVKACKTELTQYNQMQGSIENCTKERKRRKFLSSVSMHDDLPNAFSDISNFPDLTESIQSRLRSTSKYSVHFAGVDSVNETSLQSDGDLLSRISSLAITAFCLLLNSETLLQHSGMFPYNGSVDSAMINAIHIDVVKAGDMVISALLGTVGQLDSDSVLKSSFSMSQLASIISRIFELMPLDINRSHYGLFSKLVSSYLQLYFTELHHGIDHWSIVLKYNYKDKVEFIESYCYRISISANLLHYIMEQIKHIYDTSYCISGDKIATSVASFSFLIPSFQFLAKDVYFFINLLKKCFAQNQPNVLNHVKKNIRTSLEVLKFANHWLVCLTSTTSPSRKLIPGIDQYMQGNQLEASQAFEQYYSELKSLIKFTESFNLFTATPSTADNELTELCLCVLCHKMSLYNISEVIAFVHSFISNVQTGGVTSSVSLAEEVKKAGHFAEGTDYCDVCINSHCGLTVTQCLAKLMCCYFTNRLLRVPSLSSIGCTTSDNYIELDRSELAKAITEQNLQSLWCPEHALKLLLLSGLWEEAVEFPLQLGDWKKALLLSVAFQETLDCRRTCFHTNTGKDFQFNTLFTHINNLLQYYMGVTLVLSDESQTARNKRPSSVISIARSEKESPRGDITGDVDSLLYIAAVCDVDTVLLQLCYNCLHDLTNAVQQLDVFVPHGVHLPSPPLYCPQPSVDQSVALLNPKEWRLHQVKYEKVQQLLFLLRASHSLIPCIKCYSMGIAGLMELMQQGGECFNNIPTKDGHVKGVSISAIMQSIMNRAEVGFDLFQSDSDDSGCPHTAKVLLAIFRQLCALLWYLHVRENATLHFRKLQSLANGCQEFDSSVADNALTWCARMLSFVKFIDAEDAKENDIENCVLSLLLELPMDSHFVSLFAHCFPLATECSSEEKSDKWRSLMSRVKLKLDLYNARHNEAKSPAELYAEKSKARLEQLNSSTFQISTFHSTVSQMTSGSNSSLQLTDNALCVGSWEFEYDIVYIEFLDTLLSILSPIEETGSRLNYSVTSLSKDHTPSYKPPLIGAYYSQRVHAKSFSSDDAAWSTVTTVIKQIHHWAHLSSMLPSAPTDQPSLRVGVHLEFLMNCLQLYSRPSGEGNIVDHHHKNSTADGATSSNDDGSRVLPANVPDVHEETSSRTSSSQAVGSQELLVEHLTANTSGRSVDTMNHSKDSIISSSLLLQLPEGTLQGQLSQCEVNSLNKSVSSHLHDSSRTSVKQSIVHHHTGPILNEEFSVGEHITSTCSDNVFSELTTTTDDLTSVTSYTLSLSTGELFLNASQGKLTQQENISTHTIIDHAPPMNSEINDVVDSEAAASIDNKTTADNNKMAIDSNGSISNSNSGSCSSNNSTLIAEGKVETAQVQPLVVINSNTQPTVSGSKESAQGDSLVSVSDQSTLSESCQEMSETLTHSITQPKMIAESVVIQQSEENQFDHTPIAGYHNDQHDPATTVTLSQHDNDDVSTVSDNYMEKDSLCTSQSSATSTDQQNILISRNQLKKILKAEIRKLLPPLQDDDTNKLKVPVQYDTPNGENVKSTSTMKGESSPVEAAVEKHVYQEISSTDLESTPLLLEVKDLEESPDGVVVDKTHVTVVVADDTPCHHYNAKRTHNTNKIQKHKSKSHKRLKKSFQVASCSDKVAFNTISSNSSQSVESTDVVQNSDFEHAQKKCMLANQSKNFPLLQLAAPNGSNQDDMEREFPGLVKSLQIFDNAAQHNKPVVPQHLEAQHPVEYNVIPSHNQAPPGFKSMPFPGISIVTHGPSRKVQGQQHRPQLHNPFPLLNVTESKTNKNHQPDFHFPLIPFKPFVPKLIKPGDIIGHDKESKPFPLLHFEHPSHHQAKQRHPLLKLPVNNQKEYPIKSSQPKPSSKQHHDDVSGQSSIDSLPYKDAIPSSSSTSSSIKIKQRHRKFKKSTKTSSKPNFVESSVQTDASVRVPSPVRDRVRSFEDAKSTEKAVQTSLLQSPMNKIVMGPPPVLIHHEGLEMKRMKMRQSKIMPATVSALQWTTTPNNINDNTSAAVPSTTDSDTVNDGSCIEVTHTRVIPDHHDIANQGDKSSNKHTSTVITDQGHTNAVITDQDASSKHTVTVITDQGHTDANITDQDDKSSNTHIGTIITDQDNQDDKLSIDADQEDASSHKQNFLNVMDIEGELVVDNDHEGTPSVSDTSAQSSVRGATLLMEHNSQNVTKDNITLANHTTIDGGGVHSVMLIKLREMDTQLTAIENTAKKVEGEFRDSNQLLDTINQLQQVKALNKSQDRKSAPTTPVEPVDPQTTAIVTDSLALPSTNPSSTPYQFPSLQSSSNAHMTDELVYAASSSDDNGISDVNPAVTMVEMSVELASNMLPSTTDNIKSLFNSDATPVTAHHLDDTVSGLFSGMHKRSTRRRLPSTRQSLTSTITLQAQRREQEKSNNEKRLRDAFSLMNDILTSKPSVRHKPSYKQTGSNGSAIYKKRRLKVDAENYDSVDSSVASGSVDWDAVDQILDS